ncbi:AMP-binding protein [uncultured Thiodictyon sp.]|uniref:class I adenylate-forming enzyme family protein n=1 Tax=uncultured Thiodictyon sp. TaxID=1846217 RepID=UPI0025F1DEB3|nr:AMP-binding protein [uncultured Thiodictyon sp.]
MSDGGRAVVFALAPWTTGSGLALSDGAAPADSDWTYDRLTAVVSELAGCLRDQGLLPGQLVAVPERPGLVLMQHALARTGAALLPVRAAAHGPGLESLLALTGAEWVWQWDTPGRGRLIRLGSGVAEPPAPWPSPLALVVETSGSTGAPRAAMLTQANLLAAAAVSNRHLGLGAGDCWLCCLPLRHIGGLCITYRCALAGAALLLHCGFDAAAVAADLERRCVTHLSLVPPMLARLLALDRRPPPSLRVVLVGGQALSTALAGQAITAGWPLHVTYGMTETATQIATSGRLSAPPAPGAVGRSLAGLEVDCAADFEAPRPLRVRGAVVMAGYVNPGRRPGVGLADGWFTTSDLACRGPDGDLCILGRADDVLVTGGVNVHPLRVESLLAGAPGVGAVAVVGLDDPVWGARLVALYTGAAAPAALDLWCREHLAGAQRPRVFMAVAELPVLESGKLDRGRLRALALSHLT